MAAVIKLMNSVSDLLSDSYKLKSDAESKRNLEYAAAVEVQSWFHGLKTRTYLRHLNKCAVVIQRRWRGFLGRKVYRRKLETSLELMRMNYYNAMAVKIQQHWRGYYARKYVFNYYSRKRYLEGLQIKNEMILAELNAYKEHNEELLKLEQEKREFAAFDFWAQKNHYLLSTYVKPGVYNSPFLPRPMTEEFLLRRAKPLDHEKLGPELQKFDPACISYDLPKCKVLPPVTRPKLQGPFRDPEEVQNQRYKPFEPTLRVETDFNCIEKARQSLSNMEWIGRVNDEYFRPLRRESPPYKRLLHSTSKYGHLPYGNEYFREEFVDKHISPLAFQSVVPPIPIFEKLNQTYSPGQV